MKTYLKYLLILTLFLPIIGHAQYKNLDKLPQPKRDSILIALAKEIVLEWGPDWYKYCKDPDINRSVIPDTPSEIPEHIGKTEYRVLYWHDDTPHIPHKIIAIQVYIWEESGRVYTVVFGSGVGIGVNIPEDKPLTRSGEKPQHSIVPGPKPATKP